MTCRQHGLLWCDYCRADSLDFDCVLYVGRVVPEEGCISELLRAVCERLARLVTPDGELGGHCDVTTVYCVVG